MTSVLDLYDYAERYGIDVFWFSLDQAESLSYCGPDGDCYIAMDPWHLNSVAEETAKLAHELGHCCTGSFYNKWAACDVRQKHENRADKWAIQRLVPLDVLRQALAGGHTEPWDLADFLGVTEDLVRKALCLYQHGNLAVEMYP